VNSYASADLFIFSSTTETQGLVLGEAKAAGLPVVAVNALGAAEMVKDEVDGFSTPLSLDVFTARILQLLEDDGLRKKMAECALLEADKISAINMAKKLADTYQEIIKEKQQKFTVVQN
jgi:glycosyltransferase involved in cell wall biosynthesis